MNKFLGRRGTAAIVSWAVATVVIWAMAGVALAAGPAVGTAPQIQGTPQEGNVLTFAPGAWTDATAVTVSDGNWEVCNPTCADTGVSSSTSFTVPASAVHGTIQVVETASATDGTNTATASTAAVAALPAPAITTLPTITGTTGGTPLLGQLLTLTPGVWTNGTTVTNQWEDCTGAVCTAIPLATGSTYTVGLGDIGHTIDVLESASNDGTATPVTARSAQTAAAVAPPAATAPPAITGTPQQGQILTMTPAVWANAPISFTQQWEDCAGLVCTAIPGQTGPSYTVGAGDVGDTIEVVQTAFNLAAPLGVGATSGPTATVSATSGTSVVAFSQNTPTTNQSVTLVATVISNSPNAAPHGSLSFFNGSDAIPGCAGKGVSGHQSITIVCQASFPAGVAQISAAYLADPTSLVAGSSSDTNSVSIGKGPTSVSIAVTPKVAPGGHATYVATLGVPASDAGPTLPGGSIEFLDGGQPIGACASQTLSNLTATCSVSYPSPGTHSISALYNGDANFTGSTSPASGVQIVKGAAKAPTVHGTLGSTLGWKIGYHPHYSELIGLEAFAVAKGTSIVVECHGQGCPFAKWRLAKAASSISLLSRFRHRHLRAGTRITVRMTRQGWVGKSYSFTIRPGRAPMVRKTCLAPGGVKPVSCPSHSA